MEGSWKQLKLGYLTCCYGKHVPKCKGYHDDRQVYANIYSQVIKAVKSLPDEPDNYVRTAMNHEIARDANTMDKIIKVFWEEEGTLYQGMGKGRFHGLPDGAATPGRMTVLGLFQKVAALSAQCSPKEVVLVDIDTGECVTGKSFVDILTDYRITWDILWEVEVLSIRNDYGHLSVVYDSGVEQGNGDPDGRGR